MHHHHRHRRVVFDDENFGFEGHKLERNCHRGITLPIEGCIWQTKKWILKCFEKSDAQPVIVSLEAIEANAWPDPGSLR